MNINNVWPFLAVAIIAAACDVSNATPMVAAASLVGIIFVLGVAYQWKHANLFGAVLAVFIAVFSYEAEFYGNAIVNIALIVPMSIYGWINWMRRSKEDGTVKRVMGRADKENALLLSGMSACFVYLSLQDSGGNLIILDAITAVLPVAATVLLVAGYKEQWYAWIPYNFIEIIMWFTVASGTPEMLAILAMRIVFFINSLFGYYNWEK